MSRKSPIYPFGGQCFAQQGKPIGTIAVKCLKTKCHLTSLFCDPSVNLVQRPERTFTVSKVLPDRQKPIEPIAFHDPSFVSPDQRPGVSPLRIRGSPSRVRKTILGTVSVR